MQQIHDDTQARIRARNEMYDLIQIESLKWAFQEYGNALNSVTILDYTKQDEIIRLKTAIDDLLPTLSEKTAAWLDHFFPEQQWTVVTTKKNRRLKA